MNKSVPVKDASIMAVMSPKGLAAAVLASIAFQQGINGGEFIKDVVYSVILISIVMTSILLLALERTKLGNYYGWIFSPDRPKLLFRIKPIFKTKKKPGDSSQ